MFIVLDEGVISVFIILRNDVSDKTSVIASSISVVQNRLEILTFSLVDQFEIIVLLIKKLSFHLVYLLLLSKDVGNYGFISFHLLRTLFSREP